MEVALWRFIITFSCFITTTQAASDATGKQYAVILLPPVEVDGGPRSVDG